MKKLLVVVLSILVLSFAFSETVIFEFWHAMGGGQGETLEALADAFNAENPDVQVRLIYVGNYGALNQRLLSTVTAYMQGSGEGLPTIAQSYGNWTAMFLFSDVVEELNDYINDDPDFRKVWENEIYDVFKNMTTWGETIYAVPFNKSTYVYYYNEDLFDLYGLDLPKTYEDLIFVNEVLTEDFTGNGEIDQYGLGTRTTVDDFQIVYYGHGGEFLQYEGNGLYSVVFDKEKARAALNVMQTMIDKNIALFQGGFLDGPFGQGQIAAYMGTIAGQSYVDRSARGRMNWSWAPLPSVFGESRSQIAGTDLIMFNWVDQDKRDAAFRFMQFLLEPVNMAYWSINTGYVPVRRDVQDLSQWQAHIARDNKPQIALAALETAVPDPNPAAWFTIRGSIALTYQNFVSGQISIEEAVNRIERVLYEDLRETGELYE